MNSGYFLRPLADRDLDAIADDLTERAGIDLGLRFLAEAAETFELLARQPGIGWNCKVTRPELRDVRTFCVSTSFRAYLIFYLPADGQIEVLPVLHGVQDLEALFDNKPS